MPCCIAIICQRRSTVQKLGGERGEVGSKVNVKTIRQIVQIVVAFSEKLNFNVVGMRPIVPFPSAYLVVQRGQLCLLYNSAPERPKETKLS